MTVMSHQRRMPDQRLGHKESDMRKGMDAPGEEMRNIKKRAKCCYREASVGAEMWYAKWKDIRYLDMRGDRVRARHAVGGPERMTSPRRRKCMAWRWHAYEALESCWLLDAASWPPGPRQCALLCTWGTSPLSCVPPLDTGGMSAA